MRFSLKNFRATISIVVGLFFCLHQGEVQAQQRFSRMNQEYAVPDNQIVDSPKYRSHASIRPYRIADLKQLDSLAYEAQFAPRKNPYQHRFLNWSFRKLFNENLVEIHHKEATVVVNPLVDFQGGYDFGKSKALWTNDRGFEAYGDLGSNFSFYTSFHEIQGTFPAYVDDYVYRKRIIPGLGLIRNFEYGEGFDYSYATGYVSYSPSSYFSFQFGTGKNFFGNGYRSLILSDNAFSYPFLKVSSEFWHIKYVNLFTQLQDISQRPSRRIGYAKKYASMHYLDWAVTKRLNIAIFEGIVWQAQDSTGYRGFDVSYLNPVIFYRPVEFSLGSPDNAILGMNASYKLCDRILLYGQIMLDEFKLKELTSGEKWWANKYAFQFGVKAYDALKIKNLYLQAEFNTARPYIYSHWDGLQAYGHMNSPLGHTLGANFREFIGIAQYQYQRWHFRYQFIYALYGEDKDGKSFGGDVFKSYNDRDHDYGNYIGQGIHTELYFQNIRASYLLNPKYNLNLFMEARIRDQVGGIQPGNNTSISFGIRTSVGNVYTDF